MFEDIKLEWRGNQVVVPSNQVMRAIAVVEESVTLVELQRMMVNDTPKLSKISMGFGALLRFAGQQVTDEEVYQGLFEAGETRDSVLSAIVIMLQMMVPKHAQKLDATTKKKRTAGAARISRKRTSSRSAAGK